MTCGEGCPPPHELHAGMEAPSTALEWCIVPLPSCAARRGGWTDSHPTITGRWFGSGRQGSDQLMERWVLLLPPFPTNEGGCPLSRQDESGCPSPCHPPSPIWTAQVQRIGSYTVAIQDLDAAPLAPSGKYSQEEWRGYATCGVSHTITITGRRLPSGPWTSGLRRRLPSRAAPTSPYSGCTAPRRSRGTAQSRGGAPPWGQLRGVAA